MSKDITLGILGSGQLGTELVKSAKRIGIKKIVVLSDIFRLQKYFQHKKIY